MSKLKDCADVIYRKRLGSCLTNGKACQIFSSLITN